MCRLFESIKLLDGLPQNLEYHYGRMDKAFQEFYRKGPAYRLDIDHLCENFNLKGCQKLRISYDPISFTFELEEYHIRQVRKFHCVEDAGIDYSYKYEDRQAIEKWQGELASGEDLIILQNGVLTDSAYANLVFRSAEGALYTPENCLLNGTMSQKLIREKRINAIRITKDDLTHFTHVSRINAMMDLNEDDWVPVDSISIP